MNSLSFFDSIEIAASHSAPRNDDLFAIDIATGVTRKSHLRNENL